MLPIRDEDRDDLDPAIAEAELLRRRILDALRRWSVDDPAGCRQWLGEDAEEILAMIEDQGPASRAARGV